MALDRQDACHASLSVRPDLLAQAVMTVVDLCEDITPEARRAALRGILADEATPAALDHLVRALDARLHALCRMNQAREFRRILEALGAEALAQAVVVAATEPVTVDGCGPAFGKEAFLRALLLRLSAPAEA